MALGKFASSFFLAAVTLAAPLASTSCRGPSGAGAEPGTTAEAASSTSAASAPDVVVPGIDSSALTPRERKELNGYLTTYLAPCAEVPVSVAQCVQEKRACAKCTPAAKFLLKAVRDGMASSQVEKAFKARFDAEKIKDIPIDGSPTKGPEGARFTMVEFADFECSACGMMFPKIEKFFEEHGHEVRMVFKNLPLPIHPHSESAARASVAAGNQGKFWEMYKKLFEHQQALEQADLESYAKDLKLDVSKFRADMTAPATTERLAKDKKLADQLALRGTPSIFINGREVELGQDLGEWLALEGATGSSAPAAAPAPSNSAPAKSAAPATSASARGSKL